MGLRVGKALCIQKKIVFFQEQPWGLSEEKLPLSIPTSLSSLCHFLGCRKKSKNLVIHPRDRASSLWGGDPSSSALGPARLGEEHLPVLPPNPRWPREFPARRHQGWLGLLTGDTTGGTTVC